VCSGKRINPFLFKYQQNGFKKRLFKKFSFRGIPRHTIGRISVSHLSVFLKTPSFVKAKAASRISPKSISRS
jgi:hypothetical protein